jgi:fermentation-respiration switch protein FrsA (DUF1100 family)
MSRISFIPICLALLCLRPFPAAAEEPTDQRAAPRLPPAEVVAKLTKHLLDDPDGRITESVKRILGDKGADSLFYHPTRDDPKTPLDYGLDYENVEFRSKDGTRLHGWFIPAAGGAPAKATIVFSHGNSDSLAHHLFFVSWLPAHGFNVFMYDYRGYGKSQGKPTRKGLVEDAQAALRTAAARPEPAAKRIISLAHSLGCAKSVAAIALDPPPNLKGVVLVGGFSSYKQIAKVWGGQVGANLTSDELSPVKLIGKIAPVPVLVVHGELDEIVPISEGRALAAAARPPKQFLPAPKAHHNDILGAADGQYRRQILSWLVSHAK